MAKTIQPHGTPPYTRTDLQLAFTEVIAKLCEEKKVPKDGQHDRRFLRALGGLAMRYMTSRGCFDPKMVIATLAAGVSSEMSEVLSEKTKAEYEAQKKPLPSYLQPVPNPDPEATAPFDGAEGDPGEQ